MRNVSSISALVCACAMLVGLIMPSYGQEVCTLSEHWKKVMDAEFGPLKIRDNLISGVRTESLIGSVLGPDAKLIRKSVSTYGVSRVYIICQQGTSEKDSLRVSITMGVFKDAKEANSVLASELSGMSVVPPLTKGFGDRAVLGKTSVLVLVDNVFLSLSTNAKKEDFLNSTLDSIVQEVENGGTYVTRSKSVVLPKIISIGLPERVELGKSVHGDIILEGIDPAKALLGKGLDDEITLRPGLSPSIEFSASPFSKHAGKKTFTVCLATPMDVIATKDGSIIVE